jgi:tetratricopeptide (TPR) repeat protein
MKAMILTVCAASLVLCWPSLSSAEDNPLKLFEKGKALLNAGNYDQAIGVFSRVAGMLDPGERSAHEVFLARGKAYLAQGDFKNALKDATQVIETEGIDDEILARGLQLRGGANLGRGRGKDALADLTKAIKVRDVSIPFRSFCYVNRGMALTGLGYTDRALSDLNHAVQLYESACAYAGRAEAYLRQDNIEQAKKDSEQALRLNPDGETRKIAERVLKELSISASGPSGVSVSMGEHGHIFVQVSFAKKGKSRRFLLDTGATYSLIDRDLLAEISRETEVKPIGPGKVSTADGAVHAVTRYKVKTAFLYNLPLGEIEVHVFDKKGKRINNLLGVQGLRNVSVSINNQDGKVEITRKN